MAFKSSDTQPKSITSYPEQSIDWITRLIGFDTVSRHSNLALIDDVQAYCEQLGLTVAVTFNKAKIKPIYLSRSQQEKTLK